MIESSVELASARHDGAMLHTRPIPRAQPTDGNPWKDAEASRLSAPARHHCAEIREGDVVVASFVTEPKTIPTTSDGVGGRPFIRDSDTTD